MESKEALRRAKKCLAFKANATFMFASGEMKTVYVLKDARFAIKVAEFFGEEITAVV